MEEIKRFIERVQKDEALRAAITELTQRKAGLDEVIALAEGHGFSFKKEDLEAAVRETAPSEELSQEQLSAVSGGKITTPPSEDRKPIYADDLGRLVPLVMK